MERRLTAILAADVVGYSRLMGANEAGTLAALKSIRGEFIDDKIVRHQGRIVKLTGDGMLAEFPSVVSAVACAVELQRGIRERNTDVPPDRRIEFRMGVNLGDVIVEGEDIYGDGVNVAARLESMRKPKRNSNKQSRSTTIHLKPITSTRGPASSRARLSERLRSLNARRRSDRTITNRPAC